MANGGSARAGAALLDVTDDESLQVAAKRLLLIQLRLDILQVELDLSHGLKQLAKRGHRSIVGVHWNEKFM